MQQAHPPGRAAALATIAVLAVAACGGGSKSQPSTPASTTTATNQTTVSSVGVGTATARVNATLNAPNHSPIVGKGWPYSVHVTDRSGRPLSGTVRIQFVLAGHVVGTDTPPVHPLKNGRWHDNLQFPKASLGFPLTFQVVVHTGEGSVTLNWPVSVRS